jgi:hypothetical protein
MATTIGADYLVIGAGAMGMAFIDTMIAESDATVAVLDRYHQPGGRAQDPTRSPRGSSRCCTAEDEDKGVRQIS